MVMMMVMMMMMMMMMTMMMIMRRRRRRRRIRSRSCGTLVIRLNTSYVIEHRRPDLVLFDNKKKHCQLIIDIAFSVDWMVELKEREKTEKYQDLVREIKSRKVKTAAVPAVVGVLGTIPKGLGTQLERIGINLSIELLLFQKDWKQK